MTEHECLDTHGVTRDGRCVLEIKFAELTLEQQQAAKEVMDRYPSIDPETAARVVVPVRVRGWGSRRHDRA